MRINVGARGGPRGRLIAGPYVRPGSAFEHSEAPRGLFWRFL